MNPKKCRNLLEFKFFSWRQWNHKILQRISFWSFTFSRYIGVTFSFYFFVFIEIRGSLRQTINLTQNEELLVLPMTLNWMDNINLHVTSPRRFANPRFRSHMTSLRNYSSPLLLFLFKQTQRHQATSVIIQSNKDEFAKECYMLFR